MPIAEGAYVYPRLSLFDDLGEQMIFYAKFGQRFSIAVLILMITSTTIIFPINWLHLSPPIRNIIIAISILLGLAVLILGIIMLVLFVLYIIKLNEVAITTRNGYLRKVFVMELISISVFLGLNIAGNIIVPVIAKRVENVEIFNIYLDLPGLSFYFFVLILESIIPRIFKVGAISNLKKWSDHLGVLMYDQNWGKLKKSLRFQLKKMKIGQCFGLIPILSFIIPIIYYFGLAKTRKLLQKIAPKLKKKMQFSFLQYFYALIAVYFLL